MRDIVLAVSPRPLASTRRLNCHRRADQFVYWSEGGFEDERCIVLLHGDLYGRGGAAADVAPVYGREGERCFESLEGDFGIILYDKARGCVLAGRDRFGVKSLFFMQSGGGFVASCSVPAIFGLFPEAKAVSLRKNLFYVGSHYRHIDAFPEETFFKDVQALRQGHYVLWDEGGVRKGPYWRLETMDLRGKSRQELAREYLALLEDSVRARLAKSSRPVFMLSSGMDSSSVAALAARELGGKVPVMTTVFEEDTEYNEAREIVPVAEKVGSEWHKLTVRGDGILGDIEGILREANGPFYTITQFMHYHLSRAARERGFESLFGGLGGDEANCGEIEEYLFYFADLRLLGEEARLREDIEGWARYHSHPLYPKSAAILEAYFKKHIDFGKPGEYSIDKGRFDRYFHVFNKDFRDAHYSVPVLERPYKSYLLNRLHQDLFAETIPCVLAAEEFNLDKFGLSGRYPYFDHKVMRYGFSIPVTMKYVQGGTKAVLREAMMGILPDETLGSFHKKGWNAPFNEWLKTHLKAPICDILGAPMPRQREIYDLAALNRLLEEHLQGRANHMMLFWQFLNYEKWYAIHFS